jgi:hypothetical protein
MDDQLGLAQLELLKKVFDVRRISSMPAVMLQ